MRADSSPSVFIEPVIKILKTPRRTQLIEGYGIVSLSAFIFLDRIRNWKGVNAKGLYYSTIADIG